jgi:hypothetical protein
MLKDALYLIGMIPAFGLGLLVLSPRTPRYRSLLWAARVLTAAWVALAAWVAARAPGIDFTVFWLSGRDVIAGLDPYAESTLHNRPLFNPPTALPLYAMLAAIPLPAAFAAWTALNVAGGLAIVPLCRWALEPLGLPDRLSAADAWALTAAFGFSNAFRSQLLLGQVAMLTAVALVLAVGAGARRRPIAAGAGLAVATTKIGTAIPFALLFMRRRDWAALLAGVVVAAGLCFATTRPAELPGRLRLQLENIRAFMKVGMINDYSNAGWNSADILGLDKVVYHVGLTDRWVVRVLQGNLLAALTAWLAWEILFRRKRPPDAHAAMVVLLSVIFLYHRNYDTVILALPLVYCAARAREAGASWRSFSFAGICVLAVMFMPREILHYLIHSNWLEPGYLWPLRATVLPVATWLVLAALASIWWGTRPTGSTEADPGRDQRRGLPLAPSHDCSCNGDEASGSFSKHSPLADRPSDAEARM